MAEYIERLSLIKDVREWCGNCGEAVERIAVAPAADVAPVVFCRDCVAHNRCAAERIYLSEGIANPFCCRGKKRCTDGYQTSISIVDELDAGRKFNDDSR